MVEKDKVRSKGKKKDRPKGKRKMINGSSLKTGGPGGESDYFTPEKNVNRTGGGGGRGTLGKDQPRSKNEVILATSVPTKGEKVTKKHREKTRKGSPIV